MVAFDQGPSQPYTIQKSNSYFHTTVDRLKKIIRKIPFSPIMSSKANETHVSSLKIKEALKEPLKFDTSKS